MVSRKSSPVGSDWRDLAAAIAAFQAIGNCRLEMRMMAADRHGRADISITIVAHPLEGEIGEVSPLGSVSSSCWGMNLKTLEDALIQLLYRLDGQLASREFAKVPLT